MKRLILILGLLTSFAYAQSKAGFYVVGGQLITVQDTSSRKYLKAVENAGVVPSVIQNFASNYLVTTEKAIGSYSLMSAQYPFIGGTAATHSLNMNNPNGLASGFTLAYSGTVLHDANGINSQTGGYANTNLIPSTALTNINSSGLMIYITSVTIPSGFVDMGASGSDFNNQRFALRAAYDNGGNKTASGTIGQISPLTDNYSTSLVTGKAMLITTRQSSTIHKIFVNGILEGTVTVANTGTLPTTPIYLLGLSSQGTITYPSKRSLGLAGVLNAGLTDTQAIQQSQIVTFFNSLQGRQ